MIVMKKVISLPPTITNDSMFKKATENRKPGCPKCNGKGYLEWDSPIRLTFCDKSGCSQFRVARKFKVICKAINEARKANG